METTQERLLSLDVFRGLTIASMILVNNPGTWRAVYGPLSHADWHGWTSTDLIFPFFLFAVGVSIPLALAPRLDRHESWARLASRIGRRAVILFTLGLFLAGVPDFNPATIRIPGVLQRIAVCYLVAALLFLLTTARTQAAVMAGALVGYWAVMTLVPVPGFGAGDLGKEGNLAAYLDRTLLGPHLWRASKVYDPEGILSTLPALATTLAGVLTGHWLRSSSSPATKVWKMGAAGVVAILLGLLWNRWFPINKPLWTSSYVVFTAGAALLGLAACSWLVEIQRWRWWTSPFRVFGVNAIAAFVLSTFMARVFILATITGAGGSRMSWHRYLYEHVFAPWATPVNASLLFALAYLLLWLALMGILYRLGIFIRI